MGNNHSLKIVYGLNFITLGDFVGKTSLCDQFVNGIFKPIFCPTVGIDLFSKDVKIENKLYKILIYCSSGAESQRGIYKSFYKKMACALAVYDISKRESFDLIDSWIEECKLNSKSTYIVLVGNKVDLENQREVSFEEGKTLANKYGIDFYETSAMTGKNVEELFLNSVKGIDKRISQGYYYLNNDNLGIIAISGVKNNKMKNVITRFKNRKKV